MTAYQTKKEALKGRGPKNPRPASLNIAAARIVNLESEIEELKEENRRYKRKRRLSTVWSRIQDPVT